MDFQRVMIIDVLNEFVGGPFFLAILFADWMMIENSLVSFDHGVMAVIRSPGSALFAFFYGNIHTVNVFSVGDVQRCRAAFDFAGEKDKIHPRRAHEVNERFGPNLIYKKFELSELFFCENRSPEPHRIVGLRTSTMKKHCAVPAFVDVFLRIIKMRGAVYG